MYAEASRWPLLVTRSSGDRFHHPIKAEAAGLLARRGLLEALQPFADIGTGGGESKHMLELPFGVTDTFFMRALERIGAQIPDHRHPQLFIGRLPDVHSVGVLPQECDLPVVIAQRRDVAVVGPVEELLSWTRLLFALEERHQVGTDFELADVVTPDDKDVRLVSRLCRKRKRADQKKRQPER